MTRLLLIVVALLRAPCQAFLPPSPRRQSRGHISTRIPLKELTHPYSSRNQNLFSSALDEVAQEFDGRSAAEIQKTLVDKGLQFHTHQRSELEKIRGPKSQVDSVTERQPLLFSTSPDDGRIIFQSPLEKVRGCVASVYVRTILAPETEKDSSRKWNIRFEGHADALLSRGLLAVLTDALAKTDNVDEIMAMDSNQVADKLGIRPALSPGRNDGLANMVQVIQRQIQTLLSAKSDRPKEDLISNGEEKDQNPPLYVVELAAAQQQQSKTLDSTTQLSETQNQPKNTEAPTVALLLSGGVDSSVALNLLKQQSYNVTAFYLKIWLEDELAHLGQCPWEDDYRVCQSVCEQAGVKLETLSLQEEYRDRVISYTIQEAQRGRTPNPDILCNSRIKFGCFYDAIEGRGFDFVGSGHYAQLQRVDDNQDNSESPSKDGRVRLFRAPDPVKDQSYFLCALTQDQLKRVLFPIGHLEKAQVRELAEEFQLPNRHRPDSQGLCFLGKVKFEDFLASYLGEKPGDILDAATGELLGRHKGVWYHTVGQRKGIGKVLDPLATSRGPWYVVAKDPDRDVVFCSNQYDEEIFADARSEFHVEDIRWVAGGPLAKVMDNDGVGRFTMKIRHGPRLVQGILTLPHTSSQEGMVKLDHKDGGLAPGQFVVFYDGEECLGSGVISERHWAKFVLQHEADAKAFVENTTVAIAS